MVKRNRVSIRVEEDPGSEKTRGYEVRGVRKRKGSQEELVLREKLFKDKREALNFKKALKAQGFVVTWKKWDFSGLGGASAYEVRGVRKRKIERGTGKGSLSKKGGKG